MNLLIQKKRLLIPFLFFLGGLLLTNQVNAQEVGTPLNMLAHNYGFFSADYYTWSTLRASDENIEVYVENAMWDSTITSSYTIPSNEISVLEQDGQGGLFLGTAAGLAYYDGSSFTDYSSEIGGYVMEDRKSVV